MSKHTNGCAAVKGAKKNTNTAARKGAKKPATKWTAKQEAKAKRYYSAYTPEEKKSADRLAKKNGCAPWEIVAADLAAHKAINTGCAKKPATKLTAKQEAKGGKARRYPAETIVRCGGNAVYSQDESGEITIRLTGRLAENLHRAARAMNSVEWCDGDNTAVSILSEFSAGYFIANWNDKPPFHTFCGLGDETSGIVDGIDARTDDAKTEAARKRELSAAFEREFRFVGLPKANGDISALATSGQRVA